MMSFPGPDPNATNPPTETLVTIDLTIGHGRAHNLSGKIDVTNVTHGGCALSMTGHHNLWVGQWGCGYTYHTFAATSELVPAMASR